jgi:hypothetical protein
MRLALEFENEPVKNSSGGRRGGLAPLTHVSQALGEEPSYYSSWSSWPSVENSSCSGTQSWGSDSVLFQLLSVIRVSALFIHSPIFQFRPLDPWEFLYLLKGSYLDQLLEVAESGKFLGE